MHNKVLVMGGAGFIGSHTTDLLLKKGYEVRILDSLEPPTHPERKKPKYIPEEAEFIIGSVLNKNDVERALKGVDAVIYLVAHQGYLPDFSKFAQVNDVGVALLYEVIAEKHLPIQKVVLGSSQAVYGEGKYGCGICGVVYPLPRSLAQLEKGDWEIRCPNCGEAMVVVPTNEDRANPHNQYAVSKYAQELYAMTLGRRYNIPTTVLRYSITQGARHSFYNPYSGILRIFTIRMLTHKPLVIYEDGKQLRDYVSVRDVVEANLLALENGKMDFEVYNVGRGKDISVLNYTKLFCSITGYNAEIQTIGEFRFGYTRHIISDISKIKGLGWLPKVSWGQSIKEYVAWVQEYGKVGDWYAEAERVMRGRG